jgi:hypothetical protein
MDSNFSLILAKPSEQHPLCYTVPQPEDQEIARQRKKQPQATSTCHQLSVRLWGHHQTLNFPFVPWVEEMRDKLSQLVFPQLTVYPGTSGSQSEAGSKEDD